MFKFDDGDDTEKKEEGKEEDA